jgi:hypothetical protein
MPIGWEYRHPFDDEDGWPVRRPEGDGFGAPSSSFGILLEDGSGFIELEDGLGVYELEDGP